MENTNLENVPVTPQSTGEATSNVQANIAKTNSNSAAQTSAVNPITIPIQIQPTVGNVSNNNATVKPAEPNQMNSNLQVNSMQNTNQPVSAPTPQTYNAGQNTSNNTIDFNQIYSAYNKATGNNNTQSNYGSSGVKKTSYNTTIVTPTNNTNSVEGQYQSAYANTINSLISEMLTQMNNGFTYDPQNDNALKLASEYAANTTLQGLAGSGILNSSSTTERVARVVSELIPTYEEKAHDRWVEYLGQLADTAQIVMSYDSQQFEYWKDAKDRAFQEKQFEYQKKQDELENAWKRVDELGYVDNKASTILGVAVGTLSGEARLAKEQQEFELAKMREQLDVEYKNDVALYKLKSSLDLEQSKALASYNSELNRQQTKYEYELANKYGSSKSSSSSSSTTTSLSTYKDIINNRFAEYDDMTKKYTTTNNADLYNYLVSEYASNRMSESDFMSLVAMYNVTEPTSQEKAKQARIKYLESLK